MNEESREARLPYGTSESTSQYTFDYEPIRGYPELRWTGKRPFRGTTYFPAQLKESHGDSVDGWRNKLYWGDNLQVMSHLLGKYRNEVQLIYIDPPFDSKADYKKKIELRGANAASDSSAFEEKQYTDIWTNDEYLQFMYERLILMRELLSAKGSIYIHCDTKKSHYLRLICDEIFGGNKLRNEIVWHYENKLGTGGETIDKRHDNLLVYTKTDKWINNICYEPVKKVKPQPVTQKIDGKRVWLKDGDGNLLYETSKGNRPIGDVWAIPIINPVGLERLGYPTQKPEELLSRIIEISSNPGDIVFDSFMGSGTTQAVAMRLGRRFLGADINLGAIQTTTKRLLGVAESTNNRIPELSLDGKSKPSRIYNGFEVYTVNHYDLFKNELEARELLIEALELQKLPGNMLWDGEKDGWMVKILAVNRLATAADLNPILGNLDYKTWERRSREHPDRPVERIRFVCMGHDPDLKAQFLDEMAKIGFRVELEVLDILRDRKELQFKREAEAKIVLTKKKLEIQSFYPMNLLQKLSIERAKVGEWRELVDSVLIDWNYDGAVFSPSLSDIPDKNTLVRGTYDVPDDAGTVRVKITDLIAESWEGNVEA